MGLFDKIDGFAAKRHVKSNLVYGPSEEGGKPMISILMPVYNHPMFFEKAIQSALNQEFSLDYEIIVCDNNHPDYQKQNQEIANKYRCNKLYYFVNEENIGGLSNWNRCIELAHADDVTYCHDDDLLLPSALQKLFDARSKSCNKKELIAGRFNSIDTDGIVISQYNTKSIIPTHQLKLDELFWGNVTNGCGCLFNKSALLEVGGFLPDYIPCPDYALITKYIYYFGGIILSDPTFNYRVSEYGDYSVSYIKLPKADKKVRDEMIPCLSGRYVGMKFISNMLYRTSTYHYKSQWEPVSLLEQMKIFPYRLFLYIVRKLLKIKI